MAMVRTVGIGAVVLALALGSGCSPWKGPCAYGPSEIRDVTLAATPGSAIEEFIAFPSDSVGTFDSLEVSGQPQGLRLSLAREGIHVRGAVATTGNYSFQVLAQAEKGDACAPWARYDVTLTVK
jgi:hypothetical protein